jgi:hypothetical protein
MIFLIVIVGLSVFILYMIIKEIKMYIKKELNATKEEIINEYQLIKVKADDENI